MDILRYAKLAPLFGKKLSDLSLGDLQIAADTFDVSVPVTGNVRELSWSSAVSPPCEEDKIPTVRLLIDPDAPKAVGHRVGQPSVDGRDESAGRKPSNQTFPKAVIESKG